MKFRNIVLIIFFITFFISCKNDEISDDEYEIINLLTSQISNPIPPPPPLFNKNLTENEKTKIVEQLIQKDSIEKSKLKFTIYFEDSLKALDQDFGNKLYEKDIGFDEFYLKKIDKDLLKSKKINLDKITFPENIKNIQNYNKEEKDFWGKYWMSRIIFNDNKTKAVVEFNSICGHFCGGGSKIYLSKIKGKWKIIHHFGSWVS